MAENEKYQADFTPMSVAENFSKSKMLKHYENEVKIIIDLLKENGKLIDDKKLGTLLDVGCGCGSVTSLLAEYFHHVTGIDASPNQIRIAKEMGHPQHMHFNTGTAENLPVEDDSIDVIVVILSLHFIDVGPFVKECARVLKPEGVALFYTDLISELTSSDNDKLPTIVDEITEMNRKCYVIAESTSHPERHILDEFQAVYNSIDWPGKKKVKRKLEFASNNLAAIRDYHLSVPFYARLGEPTQNPMTQVFEAAKKILGMENVDAEAIKVRANFSASVIILEKKSNV